MTYNIGDKITLKVSEAVQSAYETPETTEAFVTDIDTEDHEQPYQLRVGNSGPFGSWLEVSQYEIIATPAANSDLDIAQVLFDFRDERAKRPDRAALERIAAECEADIPYDDGNETAKLIGKRIREALALEPEADQELQDRIEVLEKNLADERAKRPDREQIDRIQFEIDNVHQIHGDTCLCGFKSSRSRSRTEHLTALFAEAVLALEPEAREEPKHGLIEDYAAVQAPDWVKVNAKLQAREEAEYFRDGDGDLWKFTDKGEWFHEEEPGEFRQVLSIDAEDQTLTPVGHAELAPAPEVTDAEVEAAAQAICGRRYGGNGKLVKTNNPQDYRDARAALEAARDA